MFHYVTFFTVAPEAEEAFVRGLRMGGNWLRQGRRVEPDLVAADLLRHQCRPRLLCHDIWTTPEAYAHACGSEAVRKLLDARKQMAADYFEIGAFAFPALGDPIRTCSHISNDQIVGLPTQEAIDRSSKELRFVSNLIP